MPIRIADDLAARGQLARNVRVGHVGRFPVVGPARLDHIPAQDDARVAGARFRRGGRVDERLDDAETRVGRRRAGACGGGSRTRRSRQMATARRMRRRRSQREPGVRTRRQAEARPPHLQNLPALELEPLERLGRGVAGLVRRPPWPARGCARPASPVSAPTWLTCCISAAIRAVHAAGDVFPVVGVIGPEQIDLVDPPAVHVLHQLLGEDVPLARGLHRIQRRLSRGAVVRVKLVVPPGIDRHARCADGTGVR